MFALYEWFMLPMTITCRPSRYFFLFLFCFIFLCLQKLYIHRHLWEKLFFVHLHSYTRQTFSVYTRIKNFFSLYQHGLYENSIPVQRLLFRFFIIHSWFIQKFLYIHSLLTHKNLFSRIIYTHTLNLSIHFFSFTYKNSFLFFIYRHDICSQRLFLFQFLVLSWFLFVLFLGRSS